MAVLALVLGALAVFLVLAYFQAPLIAWTAADWARAEALLRRVLGRVGEGEYMTDTTGTTLQMRRRISGPEFAIVGPAIDVRPKP